MSTRGGSARAAESDKALRFLARLVCSWEPAVKMMNQRVLSYDELGEIDQFHSKANALLHAAREQLDSFDYDFAVRRSQEAVELYIKTIFRFIGAEYPKSHDLETAFHDVSRLLITYEVGREKVARMVLANSTMGLWRSPSFYGDERLGVARVFRQKEAQVAIGFAEEIGAVCESVRSWFYRRAAQDEADDLPKENRSGFSPK